MKFLALALVSVVVAFPLTAHPHEWVDWGAGLVLEEKKPLRVVGIQVELTWDEWYSALVLADFPGIAAGTLGAADLNQLDLTYGLGSSSRASSLTITVRGEKAAGRPSVRPPRTNGKTVTLVYFVPLAVVLDRASELRVSLYDPTYYTDMGIRAKSGAFFVGAQDPGRYAGSFAFEQDFAHPYYGGSVFPEVVVFSLKP